MDSASDLFSSSHFLTNDLKVDMDTLRFLNKDDLANSSLERTLGSVNKPGHGLEFSNPGLEV